MPDPERFYVIGSLGAKVWYITPRDPRFAGLNDLAECELCGAVVDVGGEIKEHTESHQPDWERD